MLERFDLAGARRSFQAFVAAEPADPDGRLQLARIERRLGNDDAALNQLGIAESLGGVEEQVRLERTLLLAQNGQLAQAEAQLLGLADAPQFADRHLVLEALCKGYLRTFRLPQALDCAERLHADRPNHRHALLWKGQALFRLRRFAEARETFRELVDRDPDNVEARLLFAVSLADDNQPRAALEQFDWILARDAAASSAAVGKARCLIALDRVPEARELLDAILEREPQAKDALLMRGKAELAADHAAAAEPFLERAAKAAPFDREAVYSYASCLRRLQRSDDADRWFERLRGIDRRQRELTVLTQKIVEQPHDPDWRRQVGEIFLQSGDATEGVRWLQSALQEEPAHAPTHAALAKHFREIGRLDLAKRHEDSTRKP